MQSAFAYNSSIHLVGLRLLFGLCAPSISRLHSHCYIIRGSRLRSILRPLQWPCLKVQSLNCFPRMTFFAQELLAPQLMTLELLFIPTPSLPVKSLEAKIIYDSSFHYHEKENFPSHSGTRSHLGSQASFRASTTVVSSSQVQSHQTCNVMSRRAFYSMCPYTQYVTG
jgi:hypothetical protein